MQGISVLINDLGLPTAICMWFGWYLSKRDKERAELERDREIRVQEDRIKLIESIEHYRNSSNKLLETNREISETNRLMANEINRSTLS